MGSLGAKKCTVFGVPRRLPECARVFFFFFLEGMGKEISALGRMHSYAAVFGLADPAGLQ